MELVVIATGVVMVVLTLVDVRQRTADRTVLEAWANPSALRSVSLVVFLGLLLLWRLAE
ncbi:hypothetical protein [Cellulomonas wangsupingiae]|uniref:hypothetical protein n=1 Tax=Cellulomonas wangsupingiae TaxID=2968085 RepID=UPI001D0E1BEA|nr:hypothetical protein [Cellulomonas wangsupingiae]MCM0641145.1 hypothetical protein [Cellulomonas wangsupingiae]